MDEQTVTDTASETEAPPGDKVETLDAALGQDGQLIDEIESALGDTQAEAVAPVRLEELHETDVGAGATMRDLDLLADVEVEVAVEFGRTRLPLRDLLSLRQGSLVELERRPEQKVTVLANGTPIAFGDIVVVGDKLGVHIVELVEPADTPPTAQPKVVIEEVAEASDEVSDPQDDEAAQQ